MSQQFQAGKGICPSCSKEVILRLGSYDYQATFPTAFRCSSCNKWNLVRSWTITQVAHKKEESPYNKVVC